MTTNKKVRLLGVPEGDIFLGRDLKLLGSDYEIKTACGFNFKRPWTIILCAFSIFKGLIWADIILSQFADLHAFLAMLFARLLGKKSIVVVGGYEVARVPEIGYGYMLKPVLPLMVKYTLLYSNRIFTVANSLKEDAIRNAGVKGDNIRTVPECYDSGFWYRRLEKEDLVLTVANKMTHKVISRKGLVTFVEAAKARPDIQFAIIGPFIEDSAEKYLKERAPSNVDFVGFVPEEHLPEWYSRARVYCQLSLYEGIPNALCEAMLCECVPVVTDCCGIPVAVGDAGFYVQYADIEGTVNAIKSAMSSGKGEEARSRIVNLFPLEKRRRELQEEIDNLVNLPKRE
ncbi:glycosyltransferase family 4 protein [Chloroflexota bacterium]